MVFYVESKASKYSNVRSEYNGRTYHSAFEAEVARELDLARRAADKSERVVEVIPQFSITFWIGADGRIDDEQSAGAVKIGSYRPDFYVTYADGRKELVEVKGFETPEWIKNWRLTEALYRWKYPEVKLRVVKQKRQWRKFRK